MLTLPLVLDVLTDPVATIERLAADSGVEMREVLAEADLSRSTFTRWKAGSFDPRVGSVRRVAEAIGAVKGRKAAA